MSFMARAVRFVFWFLVVWCGVRLLRWIFSSAGRTRAQQAHGAKQHEAGAALPGERLVRDPICGTHVAERLALPFGDGRTVVHFCSATCRDQYVARSRKLAANA
jgi:hypothetical protein